MKYIANYESFPFRKRNRFFFVLRFLGVSRKSNNYLLRRRKNVERGFALVVTLSLMILLTVIAVGMLSLSAITLRTSSASSDAMQARANARMALMLAIGQLQKQTGLDTRVTARADLLNQNHGMVIGAWKSWEGANHGTDGRPVAPDYAQEKQDRFLGWLASQTPDQMGQIGQPPNTAKRRDTVELLGEHSVGNGQAQQSKQIHLLPIQLHSKGAYAWWVSGENQKARIPQLERNQATIPGQVASRAKSSLAVDPSVFRLNSLLDQPEQVMWAPLLEQVDFIADAGGQKVSQEFCHDLSAVSRGLLTNTATGGWRKDISLLTENWAMLGSSRLPMFRVRPWQDIQSNKPTPSDALPSRSLLYPWSAYRNVVNTALERQGAIASWANLMHHATAYKLGQHPSGAAVGSIPLQFSDYAATQSSGLYDYTHRKRIYPVIARIQWLFSHWSARVSKPATGEGQPPEEGYEPRLLMTPIITMWNPYNLNISVNPFNLNVPKPIPVAMKLQVSGNDKPMDKFMPLTGNRSIDRNRKSLAPGTETYLYRIDESFNLGPGATKVFSPEAMDVLATNNNGVNNEANRLRLKQGLRLNGGNYFPIVDKDGAIIFAKADAEITVEASFDVVFRETVGDVTVPRGVGIYLDVAEGNIASSVYRMSYSISDVSEIWEQIAGLAKSTPLGSLASSPQPFMSTLFGARMASNTQIPAKGFVQSSPLVNFISMGVRNNGINNYMAKYRGSNQPVNSPFDFSSQPLTAFDSILPNANDAQQTGYIITGFNADSGLPRCVVAEVPARPLQSLGELTHWDARFGNPVPPFAFNIIGNSDATPLLPSNAVANAAPGTTVETNLQHDDSYCTNHVLFDDWFISSIAPDPENFGSAGRDIQGVFTDFVSMNAPLPNRAYRSIAKDMHATLSSGDGATQIFNQHVNQPDAWKTIASRLEVDGMFNVNSTSIAAWRALLGHARQQVTPYMQPNAAGASVQLSSPEDYAFSRFSVAGSPESSIPTSDGLPEGNQFSGYRKLDDAALDFLANEIVKQVRKRGPFLSLAEFVNRQLSTDDNLALAGAVQSALYELEKSGNRAYSVLKNPNLTRAAGEKRYDYLYSEAAKGNSAYGLPGWIRQADVLSPIAPILSARDDTFTIRAYGDSRDSNGKILARAVCEAVVTRSREFVDPADDAETSTLPVSLPNQVFGRRYEIISMRWLQPSEV